MQIRGLSSTLFVFLVGLLSSCCFGADPADVTPGINLVPWPKTLTLSGGQFSISEHTRIVPQDASLAPLASILAKELNCLTGLNLQVSKQAGQAGDFILRLNQNLEADDPLITVRGLEVTHTRDGAHTIAITDRVVVEGFDYRAVAEGTATIVQLLQQHDGSYSIPRLTIKDYPHADYNALMIDVARQDHPVETLKSIVEVLRLYKVRYLHLHLTDDQGWTFPSTKYPQLGTKNVVVGHAGPTGVAPRRYRLEDLKELIAFADARGIAVIPELEMPGHSAAALRSFPEVFDAINPLNGEPVGMRCMNMSNEVLYSVIDDIVGEVCEVFKSSPYFHLGSDEVFDGRVNLNPSYKAFMQKHGLANDSELESYFVRSVSEMIKKRGKKPIKWEGLANYCDKDIVVTCWVKGSPIAKDLLVKGFTVITCPWELEVPWEQWNMYVDNGARLKKGDSVLGATLVAWEQSAEFQLMAARNVALRSERTWGPDNTPTVGGFARRFRATDAVALRLISREPKVKIAGHIDVSVGCAGWQQPAYAVDGDDNTYYLAGRPFRADECYTYHFDHPVLLHAVTVLTGVNNQGLFIGSLEVATDGEFRPAAVFQDGTAQTPLPDQPISAIRLHAKTDQVDPLALREIKLQMLTELSGVVADPDKAIGAGNVGLLKTGTTFGSMFAASSPVIINGQTLRFDSGGGNALAYSGAIMGNGRIEVLMGRADGGFPKSALTLGGKDPNTFNGSWILKQGVVTLAKEESVDALAGDITVGGQGANDTITWTRSHQINDAAHVALLTSPNGGAGLNLNGCTDSFDTLTLEAGCSVHTDGERRGGILHLNHLVVDGKAAQRGVYAFPTPWITGSGYVTVGAVRYVDVSGILTHPHASIGEGNIARLTGNATLVVDETDLISPVVLNEHMLTLSGQSGRKVRLRGFVTGTGKLQISGRDATLEIAGDCPNTFAGPTQLTDTRLVLAKSSAQIAIPGALSVDGSGSVVWAADGQIANTATVTLAGQSAPFLDLAGKKASFAKLIVSSTGKVRLGDGGTLTIRHLSHGSDILSPGTYTSEQQSWIEGRGTIVVDPRLDIQGNYGNPNIEIGSDNIGNMTADTAFRVSVGDCDIDILTNGHKFTLDSGNGNPLCYRGAIQGTGDVELRMGPNYTGYKDAPLRLAGPKANTDTGKFLVTKGRVQLEKPDGIDAISGDVVLGGQGFNDCLHWKQSNQIKDTVSITMLDTKNSGAAYLSLNGFHETVADLTMTASNLIKTDGESGKGGVLTVKSLTIAGKRKPAGEYTASTETWIEGTGKVIVQN